MPRRTLLGIGAGVVVVHLLALQGAGSAIQASQRLLGKSFVMRNVVLSTVAGTQVAAQALPVPAQAANPVVAAPSPAKPALVRPKVMPTALQGANVATAELLPSSAIGGQAAPVAELTEPAAPTVPEVQAIAPLPEQAPEKALEVLAQAAVPPAGPAKTTATPPDPVAVTAPLASNQAPTAAVAFTVPGSTRLKYNVVGTKDNLQYNARAEMSWLHDGKSYEARLEVSAFLMGSRVRTSSGNLTPEGLQPNRFADRFRTEVAAHFVRDRQSVVFSANTPEAMLTPGMQDQLSVFVQIGAMLAAAPDKYPPGTKLTFETIGPRAAETWVIGVEAEETLNLPGGEVKAIKLVRSPRLQYDQTAELWLAPQVGYLPVRIKITERNGDFVDQQWRSTETP